MSTSFQSAPAAGGTARRTVRPSRHPSGASITGGSQAGLVVVNGNDHFDHGGRQDEGAQAPGRKRCPPGQACSHHHGQHAFETLADHQRGAVGAARRTAPPRIGPRVIFAGSTGALPVPSGRR